MYRPGRPAAPGLPGRYQSVVDEIEFLPRTDRRPVRDQRTRARVVRRHDVAVRVSAETDTAVGVVDQVEFLPRPDRRAVSDQRTRAGVVRGHDVVVRVS